MCCISVILHFISKNLNQLWPHIIFSLAHLNSKCLPLKLQSNLSVSILNLTKMYYFPQSSIFPKDFSPTGPHQEWNLHSQSLWPLSDKVKHSNFDDYFSNTIILFHITDTWTYPFLSEIFLLINHHFLSFPCGLKLSSPSIRISVSGFSDNNNQGTNLPPPLPELYMLNFWREKFNFY